TWIFEELLLRSREEQRRDVREHVLGVCGQAPEHVRGGSAGARADLQDAKRPALRDFASQRYHRRRDCAVVVGERRRVLIELLESEERPARCDHAERVAVASQNRRERAAGATEKHELRMKRRKTLEQRAPKRLAIHRLGDTANAPEISRDGENSVGYEKLEEPVEQQPMCGGDAEAPREGLGAERTAGAG